MASTTADKYLQDFQNTIKTNSAALKGIKAGYDTMYQNYANGLVNDGTFQAIENARLNSQDTTNRQYNDAARNYYSQYMQNQKALPEQLSNLGVTGGATESAMLKLMNQYSGNLYQNQSARANALNNINMQYDQQIADNSKNIAQQLADTYLRLAQQARDEVLAEQQAAEAARAASYSYGGGGGYSSDSYTPAVAPSGGNYTQQAVKKATNAVLNAVKATQAAVKKPKSTGGSGGSSGNAQNRKYNVKTYK